MALIVRDELELKAMTAKVGSGRVNPAFAMAACTLVTACIIWTERGMDLEG